ncbi:MAG: hypothetical protein GC192_19115 [Bacteroidetes bacterium]|nr:hypothetical protein [Bacteroidota bacterium]
MDKLGFREKGFSVIRNLFSQEEITFYKKELEALSVARKEKWTLPNGVVQHSAFWNVIFNDKILAAVRVLYGPDVKFLQHNDLHVGFSSFTWHRDSVCRKFGKGPDWNEGVEPYQIVRVGIYLQDSTGGFRLGLIPGSHRPDQFLPEEVQQSLDRKMNGLNKALNLLGAKDPVEELAEWIKTEPGDCVIFDPRTVHTGSEFDGTKYSFFIAYGIDNQHFRNHYNYYRHLRTDLSYAPVPLELAQRLKAENLYADETPSSSPIEGAWLPSKAFQLVAKQFK